MNLIDKLLQGVSQQDIKDYQSCAQLHLKTIMTTINKHRLEDMKQVQMRRYRCYVDCYGYFKQEGTFADLQQRVEQLRMCKEKCGRQTAQVQKFLDNINFYSQLKFNGCSKKCKSGTLQQNNICLWRYKRYWADQRTNVEARHKI